MACAVSFNYSDIEREVGIERQRRQSLAASGDPMHYWRERGDTEAPISEHWCDYCAGFYGVPHDYDTHKPPSLCRNIYSALDRRPNRCRQCACIDCVVAERMAVNDR